MFIFLSKDSSNLHKTSFYTLIFWWKKEPSVTQAFTLASGTNPLACLNHEN